MDRPESDLNATEARLSGWSPAASGLDRDRMLFLAGRAAGRSEMRRRMAVASAGLVVLISAGLGGLLVREQARSRTLEIRLAEALHAPASPSVRTVAPTPPPAIGRPEPGSYLVLTKQALGPPKSADRPATSGGVSGPSTPTPEALRVRDWAGLTEL